MHTDTLCQGDLLEKTDAMNEILREVHPYFCKPDYQHFLVLTQTCDLVRRNGKPCKSGYITLAAVRTFDDFLHRYADKHNVTRLGDYCVLIKKDQPRIREFLERLLNNNEPEYFYFAKDEDFQLYTAHVATLKVSIALWANEHYDVCLRAKRAELTDAFKAKLGWLIGQLYSRVGTEDWHTCDMKKCYQELIDNAINQNFLIATQDQLKQIEEKIKERGLQQYDIMDLTQLLNECPIETNHDKMVGSMVAMFQKNRRFFVNEESLNALLTTVRSNSTLKKLVKDE